MSSESSEKPEGLDQLLQEAAQFDWSEAAEAQEPQERQTLLRFEAGGHQYAMEARHVREIVGRQKLMLLPGTPNYIRGVFVHRREVVALLDLPLWLGQEGAKDKGMITSSRVLVVAQGDYVVGFDVGEEAELMERRTKSEPDLMGSLEEGVARIAKDLFASEQGLVVVLDMEVLCEAASVRETS